jgi:cation:H+ antiporter
MFLAGLVLLILGGRFLVGSSVDTARRLNVSPLVVGLTLVAWGTSAPELALNLISASKGLSDLAVGNVVGANICNMALVLGVASLFRPLKVEQRLINVEIWISAFILLFMSTFTLLAGFSRLQAAIMLLIFLIYSIWTITAAFRAEKPASAAIPAESATAESGPMSWPRIILGFIGGLVLLSVGGSLASDGASKIAVTLGVPAAVVGVTIVSIGTTLPELITSVIAVRKGQTDLAMGNVIGSCLFNAGAIFGIVGLMDPPTLTTALVVPLVYMAALALVLLPFSRSSQGHISRLEGSVLLASYLGFLVFSGLSVSASNSPSP